MGLMGLWGLRVWDRSMQGIQIQKVEPWPSPSLLTPICPPQRSAMVLQMLRPRPVPWTKSLSLTKRSKTEACFSLGMPAPVSSQ